MALTKVELEAQNAELRAQIALQQESIELLQQLVVGQAPPVMPEQPTGFLRIRSLIPGYTTIIHPDIRYRGVRGDRVIGPYSEIAVPITWRDSPNLAVSVEKGVVEYAEALSFPTDLISMPDIPTDSEVIDPLHRRIALNMALQGDPADDGNIMSYPKTVTNILLINFERDSGGIDIGYMQDIVSPVFVLALRLEQMWRKRTWVIDLLNERIDQIVNLSRRRR